MRLNIFFQKNSVSMIVIILFIIAISLVNLNQDTYNTKEGVIKYDVKSYYAFLPAAIIEKDLSFNYIDKLPIKDRYIWIWPSYTEEGKKIMLTTCGLSIMYSPSFFLAHGIAKLNPNIEANGYTKPYHVALTLSAFVYFVLALFILRRILLKYFDDKTTALTLFFIGAGTNLFHYITYEAPYPHAYNFFLIILFLYLILRWYNKTSIKNTIFLGLIGGLITLIRPTNIIVLLLIPLFGVTSIKSLKQNIIFLVKKWYLIIIMMIAFVIVWIPQFSYWYYITGKIFYFSYGTEGGKFFFNNPQITNFLVSYKKGWYIYTPLMLIATIGMYRLVKIKNDFSWAILLILVINIYLLSSWWSWWFGGSFGQRSMVDIYGLMAFPLAAVIAKKRKYKLSKIILLTILFILTIFNQFQIQQHRNKAIHYWWTNKEAYWETFLKLKPTCKYWKIIQIPNYIKAKQGIYEFTFPYDKHMKITKEDLEKEILFSIKKNKNLKDSLVLIANKKNISFDSVCNNFSNNLIKTKKAKKHFDILKIRKLEKYIQGCKSWKEELEKKAKKNKMSLSMVINNEAKRVYFRYSQQYKDTFK